MTHLFNALFEWAFGRAGTFGFCIFVASVACVAWLLRDAAREWRRRRGLAMSMYGIAGLVIAAAAWLLTTALTAPASEPTFHDAAALRRERFQRLSSASTQPAALHVSPP